MISLLAQLDKLVLEISEIFLFLFIVSLIRKMTGKKKKNSRSKNKEEKKLVNEQEKALDRQALKAKKRFLLVNLTARHTSTQNCDLTISLEKLQLVHGCIGLT